MQGTKLQRWVETDRWADWKDGMELTQTQMPRVRLLKGLPALGLAVRHSATGIATPIRHLRPHTQLCLVHAEGSGGGGVRAALQSPAWTLQSWLGFLPQARSV